MPICREDSTNRMMALLGNGDVAYGAEVRPQRDIVYIGFYDVPAGPIGRSIKDSRTAGDSPFLLAFTNLESMDCFMDYLRKSRAYFAAHIPIRESLESESPKVSPRPDQE